MKTSFDDIIMANSQSFFTKTESNFQNNQMKLKIHEETTFATKPCVIKTKRFKTLQLLTFIYFTDTTMLYTICFAD